ncbi:hypothetical protein [Mycobacterium intracellulare]|uniref:hypothetical protein n=1 Tax=Mycobacterium intracellulare TaxID=1767 RepID=UPI001EEF34C4|nr:hypothetical protein [Mycobacterium intracellulare]MEE3751451.1 hypothetical protein [Mycobacterium intracellulare]
MSRRYTVDSATLLHFADRLAKFNAQAEQIATAVDECVAELHGAWLGQGAEAEH